MPGIADIICRDLEPQMGAGKELLFGNDVLRFLTKQFQISDY
jgi:hypothetical protein